MFDWLRRLFEKPSEKRVAPATNPPDAVELTRFHATHFHATPVSPRHDFRRHDFRRHYMHRYRRRRPRFQRSRFHRYRPDRCFRHRRTASRRSVDFLGIPGAGGFAVRPGGGPREDPRGDGLDFGDASGVRFRRNACSRSGDSHRQTTSEGAAAKHRPDHHRFRHAGRRRPLPTTNLTGRTTPRDVRPHPMTPVPNRPPAGISFAAKAAAPRRTSSRAFPAGGTGSFKVFVEFDEDRPEGVWIGFEE